MGNIRNNFIRYIVPSGAYRVMEWVRLHHESVTGRDGYSDFYKKEIKFNLLGPVGDKVEEWILKGDFIQSAILTIWISLTQQMLQISH